MWSARFLSRLDFRVIALVLLLMGVSLMTISSFTNEYSERMSKIPS